MSGSIRLRGVRQNNLQGFDLDIPLGKLIVVTGLSGTGKSSLVFETLHAEGQRRYVETFSAYTRQFLDLLNPPQIDSIENIHPSIAIEQTNTVRTSRSTVGTMTELCDFFKVWFSHVSNLFDPATGEKIIDDNPQTIWKSTLARWHDKTVLVTFRIDKPESLSWKEIFDSLQAQGYQRLGIAGKVVRFEEIDPKTFKEKSIYIIQDRIKLVPKSQNRFIEAATTALHFGQGELHLLSSEGELWAHYSEGLHSPATGTRFRPATPALFSFNSPLGACLRCRGFGRIIEIDYRRVIPDPHQSIEQNAIRAFQGETYGASQRDLQRAARKYGIRTNVPWRDLSDEEKTFVLQGEPNYHKTKSGWYGLKRFFDWLESNTYKMHVRVFLSKYRAYTRCPECQGRRLQPEALNWKWNGYLLPDLYALPINELLRLLRQHHKVTGNPQTDIAIESILTRLKYLQEVGLDYLSLDRSSRTLSGGELERVNLTTCLGTSLVDTLFVLDEPSVGLHSRDIDRLISILKRLTELGNTVVVVEHDEAIMRAADYLLEIGPQAGKNGGTLTFKGTLPALLKAQQSLTGAYLSGRKTLDTPNHRRPTPNLSKNPKAKITKPAPSSHPCIQFHKASQHNLKKLSFQLPLKRLTCISGVSGSGKSTLLNNVIHQGLLTHLGQPAENPAEIQKITTPCEIAEIVLVDQSPLSRTPRSNAVLFSGAWDAIRTQFAKTEAACSAGMTPSHFSFNSGEGRCTHCQGLGYEQIEMQFLADVFVPCAECEGQRFNPEVLKIQWHGKSVAEILEMEIDEALIFFKDQTKIRRPLETLAEVGLGYLPLGQPLNTLSGGESQRLKLVKYLTQIKDTSKHKLLLLDEPTTGLHRDDVKRLINLLQKLVDQQHTLVVVEHNLDVLKSADWLIEMGPEAGRRGGTIVACGTPEKVAEKEVISAPFLLEALGQKCNSSIIQNKVISDAKSPFRKKSAPARKPRQLCITGARQNNLKNISLKLPHGKIIVITGVSGSGKSSLAFDIIFAEGQRRFMESMSPYARQFVEQMAKPDVDKVTGIPPTIAIEQRVTQGNRKSTVATITEVAQYLRLLYARLGIQHNPRTDRPVATLSQTALNKKFTAALKDYQKLPHLYLCAPMVRARKGHHQPLATWAQKHSYPILRCDGHLIPTEKFEKLDRYREHDIEVVIADLGVRTKRVAHKRLQSLFQEALKLGKGSCFLLHPKGEILMWFSTTRTDPTTGESFPELDPKHFSWNASKGWCPTCRGHGQIYEEGMPIETSQRCPDCNGARLNPISRAVKLYFKNRAPLSLPELLSLSAHELLECLSDLKLDRRGKAIVRDIRAQIIERLQFMNRVGIDYLTLDRSTTTLSGGEAQRIRLAAQLGSNLAGVLYVLDEPSIGLHARDNDRLLESLKTLRSRGNSMIIVEHDDETIRQSDHIVDIGPGAGTHGGRQIASGPPTTLLKHSKSLTGHYLKQGIIHPLRGSYRPLPPSPKPRSRQKKAAEWLIAQGTRLRNLKGDDLQLPLNRLIAVCGVSGAGKSTLIRDLLKPAIAYAAREQLQRITGRTLMEHNVFGADSNSSAMPLRQLLHANAFRRIIEVDQSPIGKTPRSTPATYIGAFDTIRTFFASLPEAKMHGYTPGTFSFNTKGGRCDKCMGAGRIKLAMNFLPDTYVDCEDCNGNRYSEALATIRFKNKNIHEVLALSFEEAAAFFDFHPQLQPTLSLMVETGLGYLTLGQSSPTLSGGEAQRLKLVSELVRGLQTTQERNRDVKPRNLYILEEPTIGLHLKDCERLIEVLHRLVDQGHTVIVIEHHLDLIAEADYLVEIGPEGGDAGGKILYQGPVQAILKCKDSPTAPFLRKKLQDPIT